MTRIVRISVCAMLLIGGLIPKATAVVWPGINGQIVFTHHDTIYAVDPDGTDTAVLIDGFEIVLGLDLSADGSKIVFTGVPVGEPSSALFIANIDGSGLERIPTPGLIVGPEPDISPDNDRVVFKGASSTFDLYIVELETATITRLTNDGLVEGEPAWSPDGTSIAFSRTDTVFGPPRPGAPPTNLDIFTIGPDGDGLTRLTTSTDWDYRPAWSPTGERLAWVRESLTTPDTDVWVMNSDGTNAANLTRSPSVFDDGPSFAPDGGSIVFTRSDSLAVMTADGSGLTSLGIQGYYPAWRSIGATRPVRIVGTPDRAPDANGWYRSPVTVSWNVDGAAGLLPNTVVTTAGAGLVVRSEEYCTTTCFRGSITLSVDASAPTVTAVPARQPDANGWYRLPVTVSWSVTDPPPSAGVAAVPASAEVSADGADQLVGSGPVCDVVGNCAEASATISLDSAAPMLTDFALTPSIALPGTTVAVSVTAVDPLSGIDLVEAFVGSDLGVGNGTQLVVDGNVATGALLIPAPGTWEVTVRAVDRAGSGSVLSGTIRVVSQTARVSGSGALIPAGSTSDPGDLIPGGNGRARGSMSVNLRYRSLADATPTGSFKFDMDGGVFSLRSDAIAWLVVAPTSVAEFGGIASIRGLGGSFPFTVHVVDGKHDHLLLRIWTPGSDIDADPWLYQASGDISGQIAVSS